MLLLSSPAVQQPDPNQPKAEGAQMAAMRGEQLGVVTNWPPSLEAALQRWGTISPKAPCLTTMDTNGKPLYVLTYGTSQQLWAVFVKGLDSDGWMVSERSTHCCDSFISYR